MDWTSLLDGRGVSAGWYHLLDYCRQLDVSYGEGSHRNGNRIEKEKKS
jgi:hypothetical protein